MASLEDLKAGIIEAVESNSTRDPVTYLCKIQRAQDAVIAHLEGELKEVRQEATDVTILYEASHEYSRTLHAQIAECQERERKLRAACDSAKRLIFGLEHCGHRITCNCGADIVHEKLSAALEVKK